MTVCWLVVNSLANQVWSGKMDAVMKTIERKIRLV